MEKVLVSSIEGNQQKLDGGSMFGNAPRPVWEKWAPPDERGRINLACRALLIEIEGKRILCETGIGAFFEPSLADRYGVQRATEHILLQSLNELGLSEDNIDVVILSHLHFDHAGGLLPTYAEIQAGRKDLLFPNARYVVGREAWNRARHPHFRDRASFIPGLTDQLEQSGRLIVVEGIKVPVELPQALFFHQSFGHTPGHLHTGLRGPQKTVFFCGDLIPGQPWVHLPITMGYDRFPELLIDEKSQVLDLAVRENWWLFYTHDTTAVASQVMQDSKGRYKPTEPQTKFVRVQV